MIALVFLVVAALRIWLWLPPVYPSIGFFAAVLAIAAFSGGLAFLQQYLIRQHHGVTISMELLQRAAAGGSFLSRWDWRIGLRIGAFILSSLAALGQGGLWFEHQLRTVVHGVIQLLTMLPTAPKELYRRLTSSRTP